MVKNLPAMQELWFRSLDWEDPLEEEMATHSSRNPMDRGYTIHGVSGVGHNLVTKQQQQILHCLCIPHPLYSFLC